jgi:subtilisin-like proprotein convertase family protein
MRIKPLVLAIASSLFISAGVSAQEKNPEDGVTPAGPAANPPLGAPGLPGQTCTGAGGTNCPVSLPDLGQVVSTFDISGCGGAVTDANVGIDMSHTWVGDLIFTVQAPDATAVTIIDRPGVPGSTFGCSGNNIFAVLDDAAAFPVENQCAGGIPTINGTYAPNNTLSALNGSPGNGTWTLTVSDNAGADTGTLNDWSLELVCGEPQSRATFAVAKVFTDGNPGEVEVTISCNTGLPLEQSKLISEGDGVTFVVTDYDDGEMDCTITESVPGGYSAEYDFGPGTSNTGCTYEDINFSREFGCLITNSPDPVEVVIDKEWVIEGADDSDGVSQEFRVELWCDSEIVEGFQPNGQWYANAFGDGDTTFTFHVIPAYPATGCTVFETVFDSAVESDNGCGSFNVSAGDGHSCTITNTVFFEGIPTLNTYGMAILLLSMLGLGFIAFRRIA